MICRHHVDVSLEPCKKCQEPVALAGMAFPVGSTLRPDNVNSPAHYKHGSIECIDAMLATFGREQVESYCKISAFKYLWRSDHKKATRQDIEKAIWMLRFSISDDPRLDGRR